MKRNNFNLSHYKLLTCDMGKLIPIACQEVIPGDTFRMQSSLLVRMLPMLAPVMHPIKVRIHHWYVPYRIIFPDFQEFIVNPDSNIKLPTFPLYIDRTGKLSDYFGVYGNYTRNSPKIGAISAFSHMAYWEIFNNFYRDEDLQPEGIFSFDGNNYYTGFSGGYNPDMPVNVSWNKDRFTSARPWTQKGEQVFVPVFSNVGNVEWTQYTFSFDTMSQGGKFVGGDLTCSVSNIDSSPVKCPSNLGTPAYPALSTVSDLWVPNKSQFQTLLDTWIPKNLDTIRKLSIGDRISIPTGAGSGQADTVYFKLVTKNKVSNSNAPVYQKAVSLSLSSVHSGNPSSSSYTIVSGSFTLNLDPKQQDGAVSIRDLRLSSALQRFQENRAKWGSRYIEYLNYLGVKSSDARLQLPEYLGGGSQMLQISEVLQTAPSDADGVVGSMKGHGIGAMRSNRFTRFFEEHGVILSLMSVVPASIYAQGSPRMFLKRTWSDYYQKDLQDIGMQEVYQGELFFGDRDGDNFETFGYQDRYDDYRKGRSSISGDFHDKFSFWHLARMFDTYPSLNGNFVKCEPSKRIFADLNNHSLLIMANHHIIAKRVLSKRASTKLK